MRTKTINLKKAYASIKAGEIIDCNGCRIWIGPAVYRNGEPYGNRKCICWRNFGQSANEMGIKSLRWIMKVIAKSADYAFKIVDSIY